MSRRSPPADHHPPSPALLPNPNANANANTNARRPRVWVAEIESSKRWRSTIKVIQVDGKLLELKHSIKAKAVTSENPNCFLCSSELMSVGSSLPQMADDEDLNPNHFYFLLPLSLAQNPLSLQDLCSLAIKASASLPNHDLLKLSSVK
ncbi:hypothetical protein NMG60_11008054 [Bertholletia excelsa]